VQVRAQGQAGSSGVACGVCARTVIAHRWRGASKQVVTGAGFLESVVFASGLSAVISGTGRKNV
jgi:hypothetical protein